MSKLSRIGKDCSYVVRQNAVIYQALDMSIEEHVEDFYENLPRILRIAAMALELDMKHSRIRVLNALRKLLEEEQKWTSGLE